ncbi:MAG: NAD(P)-binding protein, partial [Pseudomonadota bacterium]
MKSVAIIGAGLSGLVVAQRLQASADVTLFEKSRGVGGRMATRYADEIEFDHGAQFFTARSRAFKSFLQPLIDAGVVAQWNADFAELDRNEVKSTRSWDDEYPHYVGAPRMNAIGKHLAADLNVVNQTAVTNIERRADGWTLVDDSGAESGPFD